MLLKTKEKTKICSQINKWKINCVHADCPVKHVNMSNIEPLVENIESDILFYLTLKVLMIGVTFSYLKHLK